MMIDCDPLVAFSINHSLLTVFGPIVMVQVESRVCIFEEERPARISRPVSNSSSMSISIRRNSFGAKTKCLCNQLKVGICTGAPCTCLIASDISFRRKSLT